MLTENRFKMLTKSKPEDARRFFVQSQADADRRWKFYQFLAASEGKIEVMTAATTNAATTTTKAATATAENPA